MSREQEWYGRVASLKEIIENCETSRCSILSRQLDSQTCEAVYARKVRHLKRPQFFVITPENYAEVFELMLKIEELYDHVEMRGFDRVNQKIRPLFGLETIGYKSTISGTSRGQPSLIAGDEIILVDSDGDYHHLQVKDYDDLGDSSKDPNLVKFFQVDLTYTLDTRQRYDMKLVSCGACYDFCNDSLRVVSSDWERYQNILFPRLISSPEKRPKIDLRSSISPRLTKELNDRLDKCNQLQRQAVVNILEAKCRPFSYILFGPPGTGKTFTMLEAMLQIYKRNRRARVLICASSNHVVDGIASAVAEMGLRDHMHRFCSVYYFKTESKAKEREGTKLPSYFTSDIHMEGRVVVSTNSNARRLLPNQAFDYVFIDEAGHSHEPETLIPMSKLKPDGCLVLAGDPKQLGPVIKCDEIADLGLGKSLLERLCDLDLYGKKPRLGYNRRYITRLTESYRCDPRILGMCNRLFYFGDLSCRNRTPPELLHKLGFDKPMQFISTLGNQIYTDASSSVHNEKEADACLRFLFKKLYQVGVNPEQVGIVTPYSAQKYHLIDRCKKYIRTNAQYLRELANMAGRGKFTDVSDTEEAMVSKLDARNTSSRLISRAPSDSFVPVKTRASKAVKSKINWMPKIDTVDGFQGSECEVILVSTVRTPNSSGKIDSKFLSNAKRFNVTMSRAKWLVVVFGHPSVLDCPHWSDYRFELTRNGRQLSCDEL